MKDAILTHYHDVKDDAQKRLNQFQAIPETNEALFKELTFCVFAANSSADMAAKAVDLLEPILHTGDADTYKEQVTGNVRFYNVRSEYTAYNYDQLQQLNNDLSTHIQQDEQPRQFIQNTFKGIGMKEASHFLRNTGHSGYCILDKHIRTTCHQLNILDNPDYPKNTDDYLDKEQKIRTFCDNHDLDVDIFDLALWSYQTGHIAK